MTTRKAMMLFLLMQALCLPFAQAGTVHYILNRSGTGHGKVCAVGPKDAKTCLRDQGFNEAKCQPGQVLDFVAVPMGRTKFMGWSGDCVSKKTVCRWTCKESSPSKVWEALARFKARK